MLGPLLDKNWQLKRSLSEGITNSHIDDLYERAKAAGATGAKLLGAGSSGFLLVVRSRRAAWTAVRGALRQLREVPFRFSLPRGAHSAVRSADES